jgi:hypothetical protein
VRRVRVGEGWRWGPGVREWGSGERRWGWWEVAGGGKLAAWAWWRAAWDGWRELEEEGGGARVQGAPRGMYPPPASRWLLPTPWVRLLGAVPACPAATLHEGGGHTRWWSGACQGNE